MVFAAWGMLWSTVWSFAAGPQSVAEFSLDGIVASRAVHATPAFLSDDLVALLVRGGDRGSGDAAIIVLRLVGGDLRISARVSTPYESRRIRAASGQRVVVESLRHSALYSAELSSMWIIPTRQRLMAPSFPRSGIIGEWDTNRWTAFGLSADMPIVREGSGQLLSLSDDVTVVRQENTLRVEALDGRLLGSFAVPANTNGAPIAEVAGPGRLFLDFGKTHRIVDFAGNTIRRIPRPPGAGFNHGWSSDGRRVRFDNATLQGHVFLRAIDALASIIVPVAEDFNGEAITVVDTTTGKVCFHMDERSVPGSAGSIHADISPSGRLVGVVTARSFAVYRLSDTCGGN